MDIREILAAIAPEDRKLWSDHRTTMRRAYLNAHNQTMGVEKWEAADDAFLDLIDIKLAVLFDRSGKFQATRDIIGVSDAEKIEKDIDEKKLIVTEIKYMNDKSKNLIDDKSNWPVMDFSNQVNK